MAFKLVSSIALAIGSLGQAAAENCFYNDHLVYKDNLIDSQGEFEDVREYRIQPNITCDFLVHSNSKILFYSDYIKVRFHEYYDQDNGMGCRLPKDEYNVLYNNYTSGTTLFTGFESPNNDEWFNPDDGEVCLIRYEITNENED